MHELVEASDPSLHRRAWTLSIVLMLATFVSTFYVGSHMALGRAPTSPLEWWHGWVFALPLMAILMAHEFGHYIAGRLHGVDISPPYFIPFPFFLLGTMGAVIRIRAAIRSRNALLDVGAAGPLAGLAVALPLLIYGFISSPVEPILPANGYIEGRGLLYSGLLYAIKGPIPEGHDIYLNPTAFAAWAGLLVTMINLIPFGQLDGGHVGYALLGRRQDLISVQVLRALPWVALLSGAGYAFDAYLDGHRGEALSVAALSGMHWLTWWFLLWLMSRAGGMAHPPTQPGELSPKRKAIAWFTLVLFVLLFMPSWLRLQL